MDDKEIKVLVENRAEIFDEYAKMMAISDPWFTLQFDENRCRQAFDGDCKEIFTIWQNEQIAGFVILQMCGTFRGYIQTLFLAKQFRGKGLSIKVLEFCQQYIFQKSPNMFICVSSFNLRAKEIYEKFGFEQIGVMKDFLRKDFDEVLLWKRRISL